MGQSKDMVLCSKDMVFTNEGEYKNSLGGGGIGMGKTCEPKAFSFQCMTKFTTKKKKQFGLTVATMESQQDKNAKFKALYTQPGLPWWLSW